MPAPTVSALPTAPSRLSKPNSFTNESVVFLDALPSFRTQINQLSSYINAQIPNKWMLGKLDGIRSFPDISQSTLVDIEYNEDGVAFTSSLDALYATLEEYSHKVSEAGAWLDSVISEVGVAPYDIEKPLVSGVTSAMTRQQDREHFNTTASLFSETAIDNINSLYQTIWHTYHTSCSNSSNGSIADTSIILTTDCGSITDENIEY